MAALAIIVSPAFFGHVLKVRFGELQVIRLGMPRDCVKLVVKSIGKRMLYVVIPLMWRRIGRAWHGWGQNQPCAT